MRHDDLDQKRIDAERALPWLAIATAPRDGSRIRIHKIGRDGFLNLRWAYYEVARWREITDQNGTFKGWFNDKDEYCGVADSWLPLETSRLQ